MNDSQRFISAAEQWKAFEDWFASSSSPSVSEIEDAINKKTKPPGSLGQVELVAAQLALLQKTFSPVVDKARVIVFAADHGITREGVSPYPTEVTAQMMSNFIGGGAAVCVFAETAGMEVEVVDVGVDAELTNLKGIVHAKVAKGTQSFYNASAMTTSECDAALVVGRNAVERAKVDNVRCIGLGEMGIGNTTSAAAMLSLLLNLPVVEVTGRGTGADDVMLKNKINVIEHAVDHHRPLCSNAYSVLQSVGGLEIAAICGAIDEASKHNIPIIVDGFIATAAALVAVKINPEVRRVLFFSHESAEFGHRHALYVMNAIPLLSLQMRLGEGSATALAYPLLRASADMLTSMSTFADAGVSDKQA